MGEETQVTRSDWASRFDDTDAQLNDLEGMLTVLDALARDYELHVKPAPLGHGVHAMLRVMVDRVMPAVREARDAEWKAGCARGGVNVPEGALVAVPIVGTAG